MSALSNQRTRASATFAPSHGDRELRSRRTRAAARLVAEDIDVHGAQQGSASTHVNAAVREDSGTGRGWLTIKLALPMKLAFAMKPALAMKLALR